MGSANSHQMVSEFDVDGAHKLEVSNGGREEARERVNICPLQHLD